MKGIEDPAARPGGAPDPAAGLDDGQPIALPARPRPKRFDCLVLLLFLVFVNMANVAGFLTVAAAQALLRALELPRQWALFMGGGTYVFILAGIAVLLHAHQTRWRGAYLDVDRIILGDVDPRPRGAIVRYEDIASFRCAGEGVVLRLRGKPWTRWLGPVVPCEGTVMHRVVTRLEAHGVRRNDG